MSMQMIGNHHQKTVKGEHRKGELIQNEDYSDGRTKQCFKDECDIEKIMARADRAGTISHLDKYQGVYADFSDYDFHAQTAQLTRGREIFDDLPAELRQEFGQSPAKFFAFVNDPSNLDKLREILPGLAAPGIQLPQTSPPNADTQAAQAASEAANAAPPAPATPVDGKQADSPPAAPAEPK